MNREARRAVEQALLDYLRRTRPGTSWTIVREKVGQGTEASGPPPDATASGGRKARPRAQA